MFVIEAAGRCFLVGVGDGPMALLAELDADKLPKAASEAAGAAALRRRARARARAPGAPAAPASGRAAVRSKPSARPAAGGGARPSRPRRSPARPPRTRPRIERRGPGVAPAGPDPGDGGAVADPVRAADGDVVRAHLGGAVDPAQRDRHAVGPADAGADRAGAGADHRRDGADRRSGCTTRWRPRWGWRRAPTSPAPRRVGRAADRRRPRQGAAARVPPQARRPARPRVVPRADAEDAHARRARRRSATATSASSCPRS